ncbi:MAG: hypothetical protein JNM93_09435 [Bacteriovoracaceae bacterium]|nr:hypothetical protein [Bacteriovoracaceae bacterium]
MKTLLFIAIMLSFLSQSQAAVDITNVITNYETDAANWIKVLKSPTFTNGNKMRYSKTRIANYRRDITNYRPMIDNSIITNSSELREALKEIEKDVNAQNFTDAITKINNLKNF